MANSVKINISKGAESAVIVAVSSILSELACTGLARIGVHVDSTEVKLTIVTGLSALGHALKNWWDHRK